MVQIKNASVYWMMHMYYCSCIDKRDLIHASNFSTLGICYSAPAYPTALKFVAELSYHYAYIGETLSLHRRNSKLNSKLINKVILLLSYKIKCVFKTSVQIQSQL